MKFAIVVLLIACAASQVQAFSKNHGVPGGANQVDLSNPSKGFLDAVSYVKANFLTQCTGNNGINSSVQLYNVIKATYQVVAGMNYQITFKADHYTKNSLTVKVFASLPNKGVTTYQINECK